MPPTGPGAQLPLSSRTSFVHLEGLLPSPTPLRRELLVQFGILFTVAVFLVGAGVAFLLPVLESPAQGVYVTTVLLIADLVILFAFGGALLQRILVGPTQRLSSGARRVAEGDYHHRIEEMQSLELEQVRQSVNAMADCLIHDQQRLADNIESLEYTNQELVEARNQVIHSARLASAGTLAAGIAHEVGNPLGAIMAFVDVARRRAEREGGDTELLDSIRGEAVRIDRIVRGLLDYARPQESDPGRASPKAVLERVRELLDSQGKLDGLDDHWTTQGDIADVVMDPHRLEHVLVNLILNAIQAVENQAAPRLEVSLSMDSGQASQLPRKREGDPPGINYLHRRRISRDEGGRGIDPLSTARHVVVIEVADNGPGVPEEHLDRVFDPFFTTKEPGKGVGLGLSICARLIEGMGGRIEAGNREGGGSTFLIRLPGWREMVDEEARKGSEAE